LGKLQLGHGSIQKAIPNLEKAVATNPESEPIHRELLAAYRKDSRAEDAEREEKRYSEMQGKHSTANEKKQTYLSSLR
jgi:hypothetical protein